MYLLTNFMRTSELPVISSSDTSDHVYEAVMQILHLSNGKETTREYLVFIHSLCTFFGKHFRSKIYGSIPIRSIEGSSPVLDI